MNLFQDAVVDLELDELNRHECMATLTGLIGHMHRNNITPKMDQVTGLCALAKKGLLTRVIKRSNNLFSPFFIKQGSTPVELPPWMKFLHIKLANPATHLNIRLFISKLIINTEEVNISSCKSLPKL